jgi:hypothetical protein
MVLAPIVALGTPLRGFVFLGCHPRPSLQQVRSPHFS